MDGDDEAGHHLCVLRTQHELPLLLRHLLLLNASLVLLMSHDNVHLIFRSRTQFVYTRKRKKESTFVFVFKLFLFGSVVDLAIPKETWKLDHKETELTSGSTALSLTKEERKATSLPTWWPWWWRCWWRKWRWSSSGWHWLWGFLPGWLHSELFTLMVPLKFPKKYSNFLSNSLVPSCPAGRLEQLMSPWIHRYSYVTYLFFHPNRVRPFTLFFRYVVCRPSWSFSISARSFGSISKKSSPSSILDGTVWSPSVFSRRASSTSSFNEKCKSLARWRRRAETKPAAGRRHGCQARCQHSRAGRESTRRTRGEERGCEEMSDKEGGWGEWKKRLMEELV